MSIIQPPTILDVEASGFGSDSFPIEIGVKRIENGLMSTFLTKELKVGDSLDVMPPTGNFCLDEKLIEAQNFNSGDQYSKVLKPPFKIIIGNSDSVKGTYNGEYIDFITNANRLTKVNIIYFLNE